MPSSSFGRAQAGFAGLAFLFGLVALAVGAFLVANTLAMTLSERTREIGLLRAAGTTSRQVMGLFLRQGLALGLLGGGVGVLLGVAVAAILITVLQSSRALLIGGLPFHPTGAAAGLRARCAGHPGRRAGACPGGLAGAATRRVAPFSAAGPDARRAAAVGDRPGDRGRGGGRGRLPAAARRRIAVGRTAGGRDPAGRRAAGRAFAPARGAPHRPPLRCPVRGAGRAGPREPGARSGAHRPHRGGPGHRAGVGGGARHRDGLRPRDRGRVGALHPAWRLCHPPHPGGRDRSGAGRPGNDHRRRSGHAHQRVPRGGRDR